MKRFLCIVVALACLAVLSQVAVQAQSTTVHVDDSTNAWVVTPTSSAAGATLSSTFRTTITTTDAAGAYSEFINLSDGTKILNWDATGNILSGMASTATGNVSLVSDGAGGNTMLEQTSLGSVLSSTDGTNTSSLTVATAGTTIVGGVTVNGGASVFGGIDNHFGGITNAGVISGVTSIDATTINATTINASGMITGTGGANITGTTTLETLDVTDGATITCGTTTDTLDVTGLTTTDSLHVVHNAGVGGNLAVTGNTTITGNASVGGLLSTNGIDNNGYRISGVANGVAAGDVMNVRQVNGLVNGLESNLSSGIASIAALAAIPCPVPGKNTAIGLGFGTYNSESAFALGIKANIPQSSVSLAAGVGFAKDTSANLGVSFSF